LESGSAFDGLLDPEKGKISLKKEEKLWLKSRKNMKTTVSIFYAVIF
jgi:hypothetical protein